jgi:hypothetical protein
LNLLLKNVGFSAAAKSATANAAGNLVTAQQESGASNDRNTMILH